MPKDKKTLSYSKQVGDNKTIDKIEKLVSDLEPFDVKDKDGNPCKVNYVSHFEKVVVKKMSKTSKKKVLADIKMLTDYGTKKKDIKADDIATKHNVRVKDVKKLL